MRSSPRDPRTQPVPSMSAWADGSASTANTASGAASIVVDVVTRWDSIRVRRPPRPELIAAWDQGDGVLIPAGHVSWQPPMRSGASAPCPRRQYVVSTSDDGYTLPSAPP